MHMVQEEVTSKTPGWKHWLYSPLLTAAAGIILLIVVLRIPTYFEPYWYGDEAIYLTIGNAMNHGAILYQDIVDHKTPLIYYFARVGSQLSFRVLLTGWMVVASLAFFGVLYRITRRLWLVNVLTILFVLLTSLPLLEGNIPNGELFVMGFILFGLWIFLQTQSGLLLASGTVKQLSLPSLPQRHAKSWWIVSGVVLGGAILTKVPALFDVLSVFYLGWLAGWDQQLTHGRHWRWQSWRLSLIQWLCILTGVLIPLIVSVIYFVAIGAGRDYLQYGLLYNFHYVQNWALSHLPSWVQTTFTLPAKAMILALVLLGLTFIGRWVSRPVRFATGWFYLALFASILSNRPYPHYLLQIVPPLLLSIGLVIHTLTRKKGDSSWQQKLVPLALMAGNIGVLLLVWVTLRISMYPVISYYRSFFQLATSQISPTEFRNSFNNYLADNYAGSSIIKTSNEEQFFIWGTNPTLYALTEKQPVGKFTVGFHIQDLNLYQETIDAVYQSMPQYIVIMHDETVPLPGLAELLKEKYRLFQEYEHFTIWRRNVRASPPLQPPGQ